MALGIVFLLVGLGLAYFGYALMSNHRGANDWWVDYAQRQRDLGGRFLAPISYDRGRAQVLGGWTIVLGAIFLIAGFSQVF